MGFYIETVASAPADDEARFEPNRGNEFGEGVVQGSDRGSGQSPAARGPAFEYFTEWQQA